MVSLETLLWQENYPSEVTAVVCLDWAFPESYFQLKRHPQMLRLARWESQLGLLRLLPRQLYMPNENPSDSDRRLSQEIAYRQLLSQAMLNESLCAKENDKKVNSTSINLKCPCYSWCLMEKEQVSVRSSGDIMRLVLRRVRKIWKSLIMILLLISITIRPKR